MFVQYSMRFMVSAASCLRHAKLCLVPHIPSVPDKDHPMHSIYLAPTDALLIVDMQYDFLPGGSLGVPAGDEVLGPINRLLALFKAQRLPVVASRDWHPL